MPMAPQTPEQKAAVIVAVQVNGIFVHIEHVTDQNR